MSSEEIISNSNEASYSEESKSELSSKPTSVVKKTYVDKYTEEDEDKSYYAGVQHELDNSFNGKYMLSTEMDPEIGKGGHGTVFAGIQFTSI